MSFKRVEVLYGQSLMDIAMQELGCVEGLPMLARDNADQITSLTQVITVGMMLKIRTPVPKITDTNQAIMREYAEDKSIGKLKTTVANGSGDALFLFDFLIH
jgi:hypothetical protein